MAIPLPANRAVLFSPVSSKQALRLLRAISGIFLCFVGCSHTPLSRTTPPQRPADYLVTSGLVYREFPTGDALSPVSDAAVLDLDLQKSDLKLRIAVEKDEAVNGRTYAASNTVREWCRQAEALGGVNGGFFGTTDGTRKETIGLLATEGVIRSSGRLVRSPEHPERQFARCVFGLDGEGTPHIGWAVGQRGRGALLTEYSTPLNPISACFWKADAAVACGPRLVEAGRVNVTDRQERLVSPPPLRRTFVAYSLEKGKPRHLVLGIANAMTFENVASFLQSYFRAYHGTACAEAMCLDGGSSTQLAYRTPTGYSNAIAGRVTVPTALLIVKK